jgi:SAM-dependent methyltransferase
MRSEWEHDALSRLDDSDDAEFYARERFVSHLDSTALATVEDLIGRLVTAENPVILDLMASWDSHIPETVRPSRVVGLGLNQSELARNPVLSERVIHDLNANPRLPFEDATYDAVICTVSVDYMTRPVDVFREVGRVLKPGGPYLVIFSNRMFEPKAVRIWRDSTEEERVGIVKEFFRMSEAFDPPQVFVSRGKPRPRDDKYAHLGIPSDPVYAVYAVREGLQTMKPGTTEAPSADEVTQRKTDIKHTLCCPYCGKRLGKWRVPQTAFTQWPNEHLYVCVNDDCPYYVKGWDAMSAQGNSCSYRLMYDPLTDSCGPIPVMNATMLKDDLIDEGDLVGQNA